MSDETTTYQLIVRQVPEGGCDLDGLLRVLQGEYGLDSYTSRQRLTGSGLALFGKGRLETTGKIAALLQLHGFACWQSLPTRPAFTPSRLRSLEVHNDHLLFTCQNGVVKLERGTPVVGIFADVSGALIDKHVKRLLAQNTYRGRDALAPLSRKELIPAIYLGQPIFDFYLLDNHGQPQSAVRVLPGRFNAAGLGELATMSSRGNLEAMLALVEEYAQPFRMHCDFGLSPLPKCLVQRLDDRSVSVEDNLKSLTHYGWLVSRLQGDGRPQAAGPVDGATLTASIAAAAVVGQPALGAVLGGDGTAAVVPGLGEVAREIRDALSDGETQGDAQVSRVKKPVKRDLPAPPDRPAARMSMRKILPLAGTSLVCLVFIAATQGNSSLLRFMAKYGLQAGVLPALVAAGLIWAGFHFVRLKRRVENTPTSKIRSIAMGLVEVHGKAWRQYALVAPMTQSACVYYRLRKYRRENNNKWRLIKDVDSSHVAFQVDDGTGRVTVDPKGAAVKAKTRQSGYPGQTALTFTAFDSSDENEKWVEDVIYEGTTIYVLGFAQPIRKERRSLRERTVEKLRALKLDRRALQRYDADNDGRISEDEWQAARIDAEQTALKEHLAEGTARKRQEEHVVIGRPSQRSIPFVIAEAASEAHLIRNYWLFSIPLFVVGLATAGFALYKLLEFLGF